MKKLTILICALIPALNAFAYGDYGYSDSSHEMSGFAVFCRLLLILVMIAYILLPIFVIIRWWKMTSNVEEMTSNVEELREHLTHAYSKPKLTYLVATGEKEQAEKDALIMLVDLLFAIYLDTSEYSKAAAMDKEISPILPKLAKLGISVPEYVTSGEKFIDYINGLTDGKVPYAGVARQIQKYY